MLTIDDVEATIVRLHALHPPVHKFDKVLRRHAYHECGYCDQAVALSFGRRLKIPLVHDIRAGEDLGAGTIVQTPPPPPPPPPPPGTISSADAGVVTERVAARTLTAPAQTGLFSDSGSTPGGGGGTPTAAQNFSWGTPIWSDEFNYTGAPDSSKWYSVGGCIPGHAGNGRRCDANSVVANNILTMSGFNNGDTGWMGSKINLRYARYETRVRTMATGTDTGRPYHPVFIVWPSSDNWPTDGEYDWLENFAPGQAYATAYLHYPDPNGAVANAPAYYPTTPMSEWHNVAFQWEPSGLTGYIDGVQWYFLSGGASGSRLNVQDMPLGYLTIQLDNFYGSNLTPAKIEVDWVRIYSP